MSVLLSQHWDCSNGRIRSLNLAVASRIYLLEPQWNPSIESQAIGRALRLGQTEQVMIIRYIMAETVEEVRFNLPSTYHVRV